MKNVLIFVAGVAVGSLVTVKLVKDHYEQKANEEIASVKEVFSRRKKELEQAEKDNAEYLRRVNAYNRESSIEQAEEEDVSDDIYVIPPEEFGILKHYEQVSWSYYEDGTVLDENDDVVTDVEGLIGKDTLSRIGEFEDDAIHVRNTRINTDFEILYEAKRITPDE